MGGVRFLNIKQIVNELQPFVNLSITKMNNLAFKSFPTILKDLIVLVQSQLIKLQVDLAFDMRLFPKILPIALIRTTSFSSTSDSSILNYQTTYDDFST